MAGDFGSGKNRLYVGDRPLVRLSFFFTLLLPLRSVFLPFFLDDGRGDGLGDLDRRALLVSCVRFVLSFFLCLRRSLASRSRLELYVYDPGPSNRKLILFVNDPPLGTQPR